MMLRRDFLKGAFSGLLAFFLAGKLRAAATVGTKKNPVGMLVALNGKNIAELFDAGIAELGGMNQFVKPGDKVLIKPNIGWDCPPESAANTSPELVERMVRRCKEAGASEVWVFDHTCNEMNSCYRNSGIQAAVEKAGGVMLNGVKKSEYREVDVPGGRKLKRTLVHHAVLDCDVLFNVPVLKHHGGPGMTAAMKNYMGIVDDRRYFHNNNLDQCIVDSISIRKPDLNVVDAMKIMLNGGPRGNAGSRYKQANSLLLSRDIVAVDTAGAKLAGFHPEKIRYLKLGKQANLGETDLTKLDIRRIRQ